MIITYLIKIDELLFKPSKKMYLKLNQNKKDQKYQNVVHDKLGDLYRYNVMFLHDHSLHPPRID